MLKYFNVVEGQWCR